MYYLRLSPIWLLEIEKRGFTFRGRTCPWVTRSKHDRGYQKKRKKDVDTNMTVPVASCGRFVLVLSRISVVPMNGSKETNPKIS